MHLAGQADAGDCPGRRSRRARTRRASPAGRRCHQSVGSCSAQAVRADVKAGCSALADAMSDPPSAVTICAGPARADIDT